MSCMLLVDTSGWIEHFHHGFPPLALALGQSQVMLHPAIIGELATGNLKDRDTTLAALRRLPLSQEGTFAECLHFLDMHQLYGKGIGWSDIQILVSASLSRVLVWTHDKRLARAAGQRGLLYIP